MAEESKLIYVLCLLRSFENGQEQSSLQVYNLEELDPELEDVPPDNEARLIIDFSQPYYCFDLYRNDKLIFGGDSKLFLFDLNKQNRHLSLFDNKLFKTQDSCIFNGVKFSGDGNRICAGTSRGSLELFSATSGFSHSVHLRRGSIVDLAWLNENELIVSAHNDNLLRIDLRFCGENNRVVRAFEGHTNNSKRIKFSIDHCFQTLTCCGDDNCTRIWSLASGKLIRLFDFADLCGKVSSRCFTDNYLLETDQLASVPIVAQPEQQASGVRAGAHWPVGPHPPKTSCLKHYVRPANEQYQVVSSSEWRFLKRPKTLMLGSISDSVDLFY